MASLDTDDYYLTYWKGLHNWQCKHCPFSTIEGLGAMLAHLTVHGLPEASLKAVDPPGADEEE